MYVFYVIKFIDNAKIYDEVVFNLTTPLMTLMLYDPILDIFCIYSFIISHCFAPLYVPEIKQ